MCITRDSLLLCVIKFKMLLSKADAEMFRVSMYEFKGEVEEPISS